ncbi:MAG: OmpH family outer membrane protein [Pseudomonadota bacterium]
MAGPMAVRCRRMLIGGLMAVVLASGAALAQQEALPPPIIVVDRGRLFEEALPARALADEERAQTAELQAEIDDVRGKLNTEEEELARQRGVIPEDEFQTRALAFEERVNRERRRAQSRAERLQETFQDARRQLVEDLNPVLEELRVQAGAIAVLDAEDVLVYDPAIDLTGAALDLFNRRVSMPELPDLEEEVIPSEADPEITPNRTPPREQPPTPSQD